MPPVKKHWDIFCCVVDNYGDIGVAWRLARQLADEHAIAVRLFVDNPVALKRIAPNAAPGVDVRPWAGPSGDFSISDAQPRDVVIEAFGCGLPSAYLDAMGARASQPTWVNLEYLSAESWIEGSHGLASRQPHRPLTRHFYFPGFAAPTGGLLRERSLFARRDAFRADPVARAALWRTLHIDAPAPGTLTLSLFCYPNPALPPLLDAWASGDTPTVCIVPEGVANTELDAWTSAAVRQTGQTTRHGSLELARVPFVAQDDYDRLLWACDLNFVRGEDSFVRAQWAAKPLVWHCYPQAENAHMAKLEAFLQCYGTGLAPEVAAAHSAFANGWNRGATSAPAWRAFANALPDLTAHAQAWAASLASMPDLATGLVEFVEYRV